jgi:5-methylcytosine-specific restriction endonuclease McrA
MVQKSSFVILWSVISLLAGCSQPVSSSAPDEERAGVFQQKLEVQRGALCVPADPDFDGYRYGEQIAHCRRHVSSSTKRRVAANYGISDRTGYEIDHIIPLAIGGDNSMDNLQPLLHATARQKARLEFQLFESLSAGAITQEEAVQRILDWRATGR